MTYTWLAVGGVVVVVLLDLLARTNLLRTRTFWVAYLIMLFFQLIVNGVLTGIPIVRYDPDAIIGWRVVYAPVEDILFGFSMITLTLIVWVRLTRPAPESPSGPGGQAPRRARLARRNPPSPTAARRRNPTTTRREKTS